MKLPIRAGAMIAGKYRVERVLGIGGMGAVVAATHVELDELRAIKMMLPSAAENADLCARFLREAQALARLRGEHVARVHDVGRIDGGVPYMVIEYVEGTDLATVLRKGGPLPVAEAVGHALQVCEALAEAHRHGIVHRDIKPQNLFLSRGTDGAPCIKVIDFGVAKTSDDVTLTGVVLGSPRYMPPEQLRAAKTVDARADIWAIGAVLYEMLTGEVPFDAPGQLQLFARIAESAPLPPSNRRPALPAEIDAVVLRCLEKDRERRFPTVAALAAAIGPFAAGEAGALPARIARVLGVEPSVPPPAAALPAPVIAAERPVTLTDIARPPVTIEPSIRTTTLTEPNEDTETTAPMPAARPVTMGGDPRPALRTMTDVRPAPVSGAAAEQIESSAPAGASARPPSGLRFVGLVPFAVTVIVVAAIRFWPAAHSPAPPLPAAESAEPPPAPKAEPTETRVIDDAGSVAEPLPNPSAEPTASAAPEPKAEEPRRLPRSGRRPAAPAALPSTRHSF